jgi:hypothetical protein
VKVVAEVTNAHIVIDTSKKHEMTVDNSLGTGVEDGFGEGEEVVESHFLNKTPRGLLPIGVAVRRREWEDSLLTSLYRVLDAGF